MVRWLTVALGFVVLSASTAVTAHSLVDIKEAARSWPSYFVLIGTKTEPTYIEHITLRRDGDLFVLQGGAPAGMTPSRESVLVETDGSLRHIECPSPMRCDRSAPPSGFLASAAILAAINHGRLSGRLPMLSYGSLQLICVPAERLGIHDAILDPCIEVHSGAVVALRHRRSGHFDGPSLDPWSINITYPPPQSVSSR